MKDWDREEKDSTNDTFEDAILRISQEIVYDSELTPYLVRGAFAKYKPRTYGLMLFFFGGMSDEYMMNLVKKITDGKIPKNGDVK